MLDNFSQNYEKPFTFFVKRGIIKLEGREGTSFRNQLIKGKGATMKEKLVLTIQANCGYSIDQVAPKARMTVGDLRRFIEDLDDDTPIVTNDENNRYGADWGIVTDWDTQSKETFFVDYIVKDKETGEEVYRYEDAEVYECDSDEEQSELDHSFGIPEEYFDKDKYVMDWEEK